MRRLIPVAVAVAIAGLLAWLLAPKSTAPDLTTLPAAGGHPGVGAARGIGIAQGAPARDRSPAPRGRGSETRPSPEPPPDAPGDSSPGSRHAAGFHGQVLGVDEDGTGEPVPLEGADIRLYAGHTALPEGTRPGGLGFEEDQPRAREPLGAPTHRAVSSADGTFSCPVEAERAWTVLILADGRAPFASAYDRAPDEDLTVALRRAVPRVLTLVDEVARPVAGAEVFVWPDSHVGRPPLGRWVADAGGQVACTLPIEGALVACAPGRAHTAVSLDQLPEDGQIVLADGFPVGGVVVDEDGRPITNAIVTLGVRGAGCETARTDRSGRFRFEGARGGEEPHASVVAEGYEPLGRSLRPGALDARLVMVRQWSVGGRVERADGSAVEGASVGCGQRMDAWADAATDAGGGFVLRGTARGGLTLHADGSIDGAPWEGSLEIETPPAPEITLRIVLNRPIDTASRRSQVRARVVNAAGVPLAGVSVEYFAPHHPPGPAATGKTDADGRVRLEVPVPAGTTGPIRVPSTTVVVAGRTYREWRHAPRLATTGGSDAAEVELDLVELHRVEVIVRQPDGAPLPDGVEPLAHVSGGSPTAAVGPRVTGDRVALLVQFGARYDLHARAPGFAAARRAAWVPVPEQPVIEIRLGSAARVRGVVVDASGRPIEAAQVAASASPVDGGPRAVSHGSAWTQADGTFVITTLGSGTLRVSIQGPANELLAAQEFAPLAESEVRDVGMIVAARRRVTGRVTDTHGRTVGGATVTVRAMEGRRPTLTATQPDGTFALWAPGGSGSYVVVEASGLAPDAAWLDRPEVPLLLTLQDEARIALRVETIGGWEPRISIPPAGPWFAPPFAPRGVREGDPIPYVVPPGPLRIRVITSEGVAEQEIVCVAGRTTEVTLRPGK